MASASVHRVLLTQGPWPRPSSAPAATPPILCDPQDATAGRADPGHFPGPSWEMRRHSLYAHICHFIHNSCCAGLASPGPRAEPNLMLLFASSPARFLVAEKTSFSQISKCVPRCLLFRLGCWSFEPQRMQVLKLKKPFCSSLSSLPGASMACFESQRPSTDFLFPDPCEKEVLH